MALADTDVTATEEFRQDRRLSFGAVAEQYDRARPGYPEDLIDAVLDYAQLEPDARVLDVGAGTGQATMQFAYRGLSVLAIEPSAEMTEVANAKFELLGVDCEARVSDFESAELDEHAFSLIYAATSWHWLEPATRWASAARAIAPGGTFSVFWTWPRWRATEVCGQLDEAYAASGADLSLMGPMHPQEPDVPALAREWVKETGQSGVFTEPKGKLFSWSETYSTSGYIDLLGTYGDHIGLTPEVRDRLFAGVERVIDAAGGEIELPYSTLLLLARAGR